MSNHSSHPEWVLDLVVSIDQRHRGFAGDFLRASPERLQVIAASLAAKRPARHEMQDAGAFLSSADHQTILSAAFGEVPQGFRGALRRIGPTAQDQRCYTLLHRILSEPPHLGLPECVRRLDPISRPKLLIATVLPPALCRPNVIEAINDVDAAHDITAAFELMISRGVDRDGLAEAICRVRSERELMNLWRRWLLKADCPPHPLPESAVLRPIRTPEDLHCLSLRYRNCASKRYLLHMVEGSDAFAEFHHAGRNAVVHIRHSEGRWRFEGAYGRGNARPPSVLRDALSEHLKAHGVIVPFSQRRKASEWEPLRRLMRPDFFDLDLDLDLD